MADVSVTVRADPCGGRGGVRTSEVSGHHDRGPADDLPDHAPWRLGAGVVDDPDIRVGSRLADGVQLVGRFIGEQRATAAALGHAVEFGQKAWPTPEDVRLELFREMGARAELDRIGRQIKVVERGRRHDPLVLHRDQHGVIDPAALRGLEEFQHIELAEQHGCSAKGQRRQEADECGVGVEGGGDQCDGVIEAEGRKGSDLTPPHGVIVNDAFRDPRRAGGIDDVERIVRTAEDRLRTSGARAQPIVKAVRPDKQRGGSVQRQRGLAIGEHDGCATVRDHGPELCLSR